MNKKIDKNPFYTYSHGKCIFTDEIIKHVQYATREDVDPIFLNIAKTAANNGCGRDRYCGNQGVTFLRPSAKSPKSYYNLLKYIDKNPAQRYTDFKKKFNVFPAISLSRLVDGKLVKKENHAYFITELGKAYLITAQKYV